MNTAHNPRTEPDGAPRWRFAVTVTVVYALLASLWTLTAEWIVTFVVTDPNLHRQAHVFESVAFVLVTSALLFVCLAQPASLPSTSRREVRQFRPFGLIRDLPSLILIVMTLLILIGVINLSVTVWREHEFQLSQAKQQSRNHARLVQQFGDNAASTVKATLASLVTALQLMPELMTPANPRLHGMMRDHTVNLPLVRAIWILDREGNLIHDTDSLPGSYNLSARDYFRRHRLKANDEPFFDKPIVSILGKWTLVVSRRLEDADGGFAGVIAAALELSAFDAFYDSVQFEPHATVGLATDDGRIISQIPGGERIESEQSVAVPAAFRTWASALNAAPSATTGFTEEGPHIVAFHRLAGAPFVAYVAMSKDDVLAPWRRIALVSAIVVLCTVALLAWIGYVILHSLRHNDAARQALGRAEERLRLALESAKMGIIDWDIARNNVAWSQRHEVLWGYAPGEPCGDQEEFFERVHPEDRTEFDARIKHCMAGNERFEHEFRVLWPDTSSHWIQATGQFYYDEAQQPVRMIVTAMDISTRKQTYEQLRASNERFRSLSELSSDWFWEQDATHRLTYLSPSFSEKSGVPEEVMLSRTRWNVTGAVPRQSTWKSHVAVLRAHKPFRNFEYFATRPDGSSVCWSVSGEPVFDAKGRFAGYRGTGQDVTERVLEEEQVRRRARCDRVLGQLGARVAHESDPHNLYQFATELLAEALEAELVKLLRLEAGGTTLKLVAGVGWQSGMVGFAHVSTEPSSQAGFTLAQHEYDKRDHNEKFRAVVVLDLNTEVRFKGPPLLHEHGVVSGISVVVPAHDGAWGVLGVHTTTHRIFASYELELVQAVAFFLSSAIERAEAVAALAESEGRFRSLTELSADWYWEQDAQLRFSSISSRGNEDCEREINTQIGTRGWDDPRVSAMSCTWAEHRARLAAHERFRQFIYTLRGPDKQVKHLAISGEPIFDDSGVFNGYRGVMSDVSERIEAQQSVESARARARLLSRRLMDAQEQERKELALEIHDSVGQQLTALVLNLNWIGTNVHPNQNHAVAERITDSEKILKQVIRDLRELSAGLRPPGLDEFGLMDVLLEHAREVAARSEMQITLVKRPPEVEFSPKVAIALFRIAQEALNNIAKHSGASEIGIDFRRAQNGFVLTITDNGRGFDSQKLRRVSRRSLGMTTMRERAEAIGALLQIRSSKEHGTRVSVTIPGKLAQSPPAPDSHSERVAGSIC